MFGICVVGLSEVQRVRQTNQINTLPKFKNKINARHRANDSFATLVKPARTEIKRPNGDRWGSMDGWIDAWGSLDAWMPACMAAWMYGRMHRWTDARMDRWMDGSMDAWNLGIEVWLLVIIYVGVQRVDSVCVYIASMQYG